MNHIIDEYGTEYWYDDDNKLHRDDSPAIINCVGVEYWYYHGVIHRIGGPAIICDNNNQFRWCNYGKLHRLDGPAIEWNGYKQWWISGNQINCKDNKEFLRIVKMKALL
jgi:hypothetical protein